MVTNRILLLFGIDILSVSASLNGFAMLIVIFDKLSCENDGEEKTRITKKKSNFLKTELGPQGNMDDKTEDEFCIGDRNIKQKYVSCRFSF